MDDRRFDALTRAFARGGSRRGLLKGLLGLGGVTAAGAVLRDTEAARRGYSGPSTPGSQPTQPSQPTLPSQPTQTIQPTEPTPPLPTGTAVPNCPGSQVPCGADCCCPPGSTKCGAACCVDGQTTCCDGGCCPGVCYGEELCCPTPRVFCGVSGQCCAPGETCGIGGCDSATCGGAGAACSTGSDCCTPNVCAAGTCAATCPPGSRECDRVCYPGGCCTAADCGLLCELCGTDHVCHSCEDIGQICQDGTCVPPTPTGTPTATPSSTPTHTPSPTATPSPTPTPTATPCGQDGSACGDGGVCCGGACVDIQTNPAHCGACTIACTPDQVCDHGVCCTPSTCQTGQCGSPPDGCGGTLDCGPCSTGQTCCGGACANLQTDPAHCGTCGHACGAGESCCSGACANLQTNPTHCGTCEHACPSGQVCCGGTCVDLQTDPAHCGTCGDVCPAPQHCCRGECSEPCFDEHGNFGCCPADQRCCGSVCCANDCCGGECCEAGVGCCGPVCCADGDCCNGECCPGSTCCSGQCCAPGQGCCGSTCTNFDDIDNCGHCDNTCAPNQICYQQNCCTPGTCEGRCGAVLDGCGGTLNCGDCPTGVCQRCDVPTGMCVTTCGPGQTCYQESCCTLATCAAKQCGTRPDGCGGTLDCGSCASNETCVNNGCFVSGNSEVCDGSGTQQQCPCNDPRQNDCCSCMHGFGGTPDYLCVRTLPEPATINCFNGNSDCPVGWVCFTEAQPPLGTPRVVRRADSVLGAPCVNETCDHSNCIATSCLSGYEYVNGECFEITPPVRHGLLR